MKKRPLSIRILTLLFLLAPLGLIGQLIFFYRIPRALLYLTFHPSIWTVQATVFAVLTPLVGLCVWTVHKWAYFALIGYFILLTANDVIVAVVGDGLWDTTATVIFGTGLLILAALVVRKEFYSPYFNPRLRWWENAHRYVTDRIKILVRDCGTDDLLFEAKSFDVSVTGIYVATDHVAGLGTCMVLDIAFPNGEKARVPGEIVWVHGGNDKNPPGFGCRFTCAGKHFKTEMAKAIRGLHAALRDR